MGSFNVNRSVSDQFYRYKMPRLLAKVEGKGNGIKTVLVNMVDVAKALNRPPTYPTKYFGCELGAQTNFDFKNDRFIVNGSHDSGKLQGLLDGFIKRFVLCPECDNPETDLWPHVKKGTISQQCKACGYNGAVDMRHRLTTFILKNPPDQNPSTVGASLTVPKEKRKSKRKGEKGKNNGSMSPQADKGDSDNEIWSSDKIDSDDDWAVDTSEEAVAKRMEDLTDGAKGITLNDDLERSQQERLEIFYNFVKKRKDEGKIDGQDKEIAGEAERLDVKDKGTIVLSELLFDDNMVSQIKAHRILFLRFTHANQKAQKYLLGGFEQLVNVYRAALLPKVPHVLKAFYDGDILEEEVIVDWGGKVSKKYVAKDLAQEIHEKAAPFIKWLKEAEEEESCGDDDDDESDDEDHVEVVYSDRDLPSQVTKLTPAKVVKREDEDDIDIDAI